MPDADLNPTHPRVQDAQRNLIRALAELAKCSDLRPDLPRELREVAAASALVAMAKALELRTVQAARGVTDREGQRAVFTATGVARGSGRHAWSAIGAAVGITAQSAHERWAERIRPS